MKRRNRVPETILGDVDVFLRYFYIRKENIASINTIKNIAVTTLEVVYLPTLSAPPET